MILGEVLKTARQNSRSLLGYLRKTTGRGPLTPPPPSGRGLIPVSDARLRYPVGAGRVHCFVTQVLTSDHSFNPRLPRHGSPATLQRDIVPIGSPATLQPDIVPTARREPGRPQSGFRLCGRMTAAWPLLLCAVLATVPLGNGGKESPAGRSPGSGSVAG